MQHTIKRSIRRQSSDSESTRPMWRTTEDISPDWWPALCQDCLPTSWPFFRTCHTNISKKKNSSYTPLRESLFLEITLHFWVVIFQSGSSKIQFKNCSLTHLTYENRGVDSDVEQSANTFSWFQNAAVLSFPPLLPSTLLKIPLLTMWKAKCGDAIPCVTSIKHLYSPEAPNNLTNSATADNLSTLIS